MRTPARSRSAPDSPPRLPSSSPGWLAITEGEVAELPRLPENWNSYAARTIDPGTASAALKILQGIIGADTPRPITVPTPRGGIQFEWHTRGIDLEIRVDTPEQVGVFLADSRADAEWEAALSPTDLTPLAEPMRRLSPAE